MKHLMIIAVMLLTSCAVQQISLSDTVARDGTKSELWVKANMWMIDIFHDAESVIQFSDKEAGVIKGKYVIQHPNYLSTSGPLLSYATITLITMDGGVTIEVDGEPCLAMYQSSYDAKVQGLIKEFNETFY